MSSSPSAPAPARPSSPWLRRLLLTSLALQVLIVVTGGAVRLTGSGLGCSTWPNCDPGHFTPSFRPEDGIHPYVEYGNRMVGVVVGLVAIAAFVAVWAWADAKTLPRRRMLVLAAVVAVGTGLQGLLGGITVRADLAPAIVMTHFLLSMVLVSASTWLVWCVAGPIMRPRPTDADAYPNLYRTVAWLTAAAGAVVLVLGTVVTGSGPHSGDSDLPARLGFDPRTVSWLHADAVMLFCGLVIAMVLAGHLLPDRGARGPWGVVLMVTLAQAAIGYTQYLTGLPEILVGMHMLGAAALVIALTWGMLAVSRPGLSRPGQGEVQQRVDGDAEEDQREIADREVEEPHRP